jgi:hypothetical protein
MVMLLSSNIVLAQNSGNIIATSTMSEKC